MPTGLTSLTLHNCSWFEVISRPPIGDSYATSPQPAVFAMRLLGAPSMHDRQQMPRLFIVEPLGEAKQRCTWLDVYFEVRELIGCDPRVQEWQLAHLTALRELSVSDESPGGHYAARPFSLTVLPPSLTSLQLRMPAETVRLLPFGNPRTERYRPEGPTAPTRLLQVWCHQHAFAPPWTATRQHHGFSPHARACLRPCGSVRYFGI